MSKLPKIEIGSRLFLTEAPNLDPGTLLTSGHYRDEVFRQPLPNPNPEESLKASTSVPIWNLSGRLSG